MFIDRYKHVTDVAVKEARYMLSGLLIILVALRVAGLTDLPWVWVLAPAWAPVVGAVVLLTVWWLAVMFVALIISVRRSIKGDEG